MQLGDGPIIFALWCHQLRMEVVQGGTPDDSLWDRNTSSRKIGAGWRGHLGMHNSRGHVNGPALSLRQLTSIPSKGHARGSRSLPCIPQPCEGKDHGAQHEQNLTGGVGSSSTGPLHESDGSYSRGLLFVHGGFKPGGTECHPRRWSHGWHPHCRCTTQRLSLLHSVSSKESGWGHTWECHEDEPPTGHTKNCHSCSLNRQGLAGIAAWRNHCITN
mmetsp:Transcript_72972/g.122901  ORF Transcript_72972/g.122901 Transcript_72972/m.122901 type:complete len:216 (-) Transcript_72972:84-731(-)